MKKLDIIFEDKKYLVINKESHLLTINVDKGFKPNLYSEVRDYMYKQNKNVKIFIVHRLDKDTSGCIIFAKGEDTKKYLQDNWDNYTREYICVVHGEIKENGVIKEYLAENKMHNVYATTKDKGLLAITEYEVLDHNKNYSVLKVNIKTGRKNQIRVGLNNLGHPILGDKKYGIKDNEKNLLLHASRLVIDDKEFNAKLPKYFDKYIKN